MEMKSMKREIKKEDASPADTLYAKPGEQEEYPYGLRIRLSDEELKKLSIEKLPEMDKEMVVTAKVKVCAVSSSEYQKGEVHRNVELQITEMGLE